MKTYGWYRLTQALNSALPKPARLWLAEQAADLQWRFSSQDRAAVQQNLSVLLGRPVTEHGRAAREVFRNFAYYLVEFLSAHRVFPAGAVVDGVEELREVLRPLPQGGIILSAHLGNWELGAISLHHLGFRVGAVALPHSDLRVNQLFDDQRRRCGVQVIPLGLGSTQRCLQLLRHGWMVGLVGDRVFNSTGVTTSWFGGRSTVLPRGPAILSLRSGAPLVPVFLIREGPWRFRFHCEPPIWPPAWPERSKADRSHSPQTDERILQLTQRYAQAMERAIQRWPTQWLMFRSMFEGSMTEARQPAGGPCLARPVVVARSGVKA